MRLIVWDVESGSASMARTHPDTVRMVAFGPEGRLVATACNDHKLRLWSVGPDRAEPASLVQTLVGHTNMVWGALFSPDGKQLISSSYDGTVVVWDVAQGTRLRTLGPEAGLRGIALSADGRVLASAVGGRAVKLWDPKTGKLLRTLTVCDGYLYHLAITGDGARLAVGCMDGTIQLWDARSGALAQTLSGHRAGVPGVAFDHEGGMLASASIDGSVRLWDVAAGRTTRTLRQPHAVMNTVRFSPDGRLLAAGSRGTDAVFVWEVATGLLHWRAPLLLLEPEVRLLTRAGLVQPRPGVLVDRHPAVVDSLPDGLRQAVHAVKARALMADVSADQRLVVFTTPDDMVELWDAARGQRVAVRTVPEIDRARLVPGGFVTLAAGRVALWPCASARPAGCKPLLLVDRGATSLDVSQGRILVAAVAQLLVFTSSGEPHSAAATDPGVTAALLVGRDLVVGYSDGSIDRRHAATSAPRSPSLVGSGAPGVSATAPLAASTSRSRSFFRDTPARPVTALLQGSADTLVAGYANGSFGLWSLRDGRRLRKGKLHGPIAHLALRRGMLYAASSLGDYLAWDLSALERPYCDLMRELWQQVPVVWNDDRVVRRGPPADHRCSRP